MGFETALNEITLVLFTTLAPSGAVAYAIIGFAMLRSSDEVRQRVGRVLLVPFLVSLVGLIASATHLGNPDNALYVFARVGTSPLSTEVFAAVVYLGVSGLCWLYQFAEHMHRSVLNVLLAIAMAASIAFVFAVAHAYAARTIVTWNTVFVPASLCLNALVGGPVLAIASLCYAKWPFRAGWFGRGLVVLSCAAFFANVGVYVLQRASMESVSNYLVSAVRLVPNYELFIGAFFVFAAMGLAVDAAPLFRGRPLPWIRAVVSSALVFLGIFVMRFAFYMMHMTVGISV